MSSQGPSPGRQAHLSGTSPAKNLCQARVRPKAGVRPKAAWAKHREAQPRPFRKPGLVSPGAFCADISRALCGDQAWSWGSELQAPMLFVFSGSRFQGPSEPTPDSPTEKEDSFQLPSLVLEGKAGRGVVINKLSELARRQNRG